MDAFGIAAHPEGVEARLHTSVAEFRALAEPLYRRDPVMHTIELTVLRAGELPADSVLLTVWDNSTLVGAAIRTPPYPLVSTGLGSSGIYCAAYELARALPTLNGVRGLRRTAVAFADAWHAVTGHSTAVTTEERLYRLGALRAPDNVAGGHRDATDDDRGVLVDWVERFFGEAFGDPRDNDAGERFVSTADRIGDRFVLWVVGGEPVSMAMVRAPASGVSRIGPVYTPPDRRGHGYGSAVTAAAAALARLHGAADVVLFADLANPVSNAIYQRIGFEPVAEMARIDFGGVG
jgi:GNAT superfamily N-acetyltransferase